ncbi:MAG: thioredoxin family protein [Muribaculaceae bacterium]|nr:thioredoxin family protein [Muribaculaceae bacterium]
MKTFASKMVALWASFMVLMFTGCIKNEFEINFEFPKDHIGNYLLTYYAWDSRGGRWIEQTASIQEGVASVGCVTRFPTLVYITDASSSNSMILYAERGDRIKISGDGRDMKEWNVKGNSMSERWAQWRRDAYARKDDRKAFEKSIGDYVSKNASDPLSAILLLTEWNRRENPEGFLKLWNSIDSDARSQQLVEMCGATDLLGVEFTATAEGKLAYEKDRALKSLVVRSLDNGLDTLKFNKVKGTLLYFFAENNSSRQETVDTLKSLVKLYPDSAKRILSDIYVDSDSMTWRGAIRRDSLKGVVRAWQPYDLGDDGMVKLGVTRLPWYIVKDKNGKESYSGCDIKSAVSAFRKEMEKKETKPAAKTANKQTSADKPKSNK